MLMGASGWRGADLRQRQRAVASLAADQRRPCAREAPMAGAGEVPAGHAVMRKKIYIAMVISTAHGHVELELQPQMTQKPVLWDELGTRAWRVCGQTRAEA